MIEPVIHVISGAVLGFLIGLTGVGGGVLTVPVLILVMRLDPIAAVGTASLFSALTKSHAAWKHYQQRTINVEVGIRFLGPALPGVIGASILVNWARATLSPVEVDALQNTIRYVIILSMGVSLVALLSDFSRFERRVDVSRLSRIVRIFCVFLLGAVMGATSIGGGILMIPALVFFYNETSKYVGTSILVTVLLMLIICAIYAFLGSQAGVAVVYWQVAGFMALGAAVGTHYGSGLSRRADPRLLRLVVGGVILIAVGLMFVEMAVSSA